MIYRLRYVITENERLITLSEFGHLTHKTIITRLRTYRKSENMF